MEILKAIPTEGVLLVGGLGTRLGPATQNVPKPMLPIRGKPFLERVIERLTREGLRRLILAVAHHPEVVMEHFGDGRRMNIEIVYSDPQGRQMGTAGSIKEAEGLITGENFFAFNGDVYFDVSLRRLSEFHLSRGARASLALAQVPDASRYGTVRVDSQGRVSEFIEKGVSSSQGSWINGGVYLFRRDILQEVPEGLDFSLERGVFPRLAGKSLYGLEFPGAFFIDIGTPDDLARAQSLIP